MNNINNINIKLLIDEDKMPALDVRYLINDIYLSISSTYIIYLDIIIIACRSAPPLVLPGPGRQAVSAWGAGQGACLRWAAPLHCPLCCS